MDPVPQESFPKCFPVISPHLMKPGWADPSKFQFNPVFGLGFPEFTDPDYEQYAMLLDGISDLDVLFGDHRLSNSSTMCMPRRRRLQLLLWKMWSTTNRLDLSPDRESRTWCDPVQYILHTYHASLLTHSLVVSLTALLMFLWSR